MLERTTPTTGPSGASAPSSSNTLDTVAARVGVSAATVSRVVNGRPGVAPRTREAVNIALRELGYQPAGLAGLPRRVFNGMIGLFVPELINPVFPAFAQAIESRLAPRGLSPVLCTTDSSGVREAEYVEALLARDVAGMLFVACDMNDLAADHGHYHRLAELKIPMVLVNGQVDGLDVPSVTTDEREAARMAVHHLVSLGHVRLAMITGPLRYRPAAEKKSGFDEACAQADIKDHRVQAADWSVAGGHAAMTRLLRRSNQPTGVICASDLLAVGAIDAAREHGLDVPGDVSIVGFDNSMLARHTAPPLTTVAQMIDRMADTAVNLLLQQIARDADEGDLGPYVFRPELVVRESTAPPPSERS